MAAGIAWFLSQALLDHPQPVFAPTAAVVALAANVGRRGRQAVEMLVGIGVGVAVGELLVLVLGAGAPQVATAAAVAIAAAVAMLATAALLYSPLPLIQAASSAVLVVALQSPESGSARVQDALVGAGVALFMSQVLFPPSPSSLLVGAGRRALGSVAGGLGALASALASAPAGGEALAAGAVLERLRGDQGPLLADLAAARRTAGQVSRRTLRGRREAGRLGKLDERLGRIDLLFGSVLLLARAAHRLPDEGAPAWLVPAIRDLENAVRALAEDPASPDARRRAGDSALGAARRASPEEHAGEADPRFVLVAEGVRQASSDILRVAAPEEAGTGDVPPGTPASGGLPSAERG